MKKINCELWDKIRNALGDKVRPVSGRINVDYVNKNGETIISYALIPDPKNSHKHDFVYYDHREKGATEEKA